mgnify:FL=1
MNYTNLFAYLERGGKPPLLLCKPCPQGNEPDEMKDHLLIGSLEIPNVNDDYEYSEFKRTLHGMVHSIAKHNPKRLEGFVDLERRDITKDMEIKYCEH